MPAAITVTESFEAKVDRTHGHGPKGDCWAWNGSKNNHGYGRMRNKGGNDLRASALLRNGVWPNPGRDECAASVR